MRRAVGLFRRPNGWAAVVLLFLGLLAIETALQARAEIRDGQSVFSRFERQSAYVIDPLTGLKTYRPNLKIDGSTLSLDINSRGFRSPEISPERRRGDLRIAIVGASTVAGAYAPTNEDTFSAQLERRLDARLGREVDVINAGIPGYTIRDIEKMMRHGIAPLRPDIVIIYTGLNNITTFCRADTLMGETEMMAIEYPALSEWLLLPTLAHKNRGPIVDAPFEFNMLDFPIPPAELPAIVSEKLAADLDDLMRFAALQPFQTIVVAPLRSYRRSMSPGQLDRLTEGVRFHADCLDSAGVLAAAAKLEDMQRSSALRAGLRFYDFSDAIPGGEENFVDASHFTLQGETRMAAALEAMLMDRVEANP